MQGENQEQEDQTKIDKNQKDPRKPTYQLRNRATLQASQRFTYLCYKSPIEPGSYNEAVRVPERENWIKAMNEEMDSHWKNGTWELVEPKLNMNPLSSKWVYYIKTKSDGKVDRYKACLVIRGYEQTYDINYSETFSPVV